MPLVNSLLPLQADEPIADYAAMDDVMQGEKGGEGLGSASWPRVGVGKVGNGDCDPPCAILRATSNAFLPFPSQFVCLKRDLKVSPGVFPPLYPVT